MPDHVMQTLGFAPGDSVFVETTPDWYTQFADANDLELEPGLPATHAHLFCTAKQELAEFLKDYDLNDIEQSLWVSWPKADSSIATDMTEQDIRGALASTGWQAHTPVDLDDTWQALQFRPA